MDSSKKHSSTFLILDIRSMICNKIRNDFAPSIPNSFAVVRQGIDRFPEHDGVIPPRPCGLFRVRSPSSHFLVFLTFLFLVNVATISSFSLLFLSILLLIFLHVLFSLIFLAVPPRELTDLKSHLHCSKLHTNLGMSWHFNNGGIVSYILIE